MIVTKGTQLKFDNLNETIPSGVDDKKHAHELLISEGDDWKVRVRYPGKYGPSDYVVDVSHSTWAGGEYYPFRHHDMIRQLKWRAGRSPDESKKYLGVLLPVLQGAREVERFPEIRSTGYNQYNPLPYDAITVASLTLAVCEYRRYPQGDPRGGGRYLPINYALAVMGGHWNLEEAQKLMRIGFPVLGRIKGFELFKRGTDVDQYLQGFDIVDNSPKLNPSPT